MDIAKIDKNFSVPTTIERQGLTYYNIEEHSCFSVHGVKLEDGLYRRMPKETAKSVSQGVEALHIHTAGGRVRFITDSPYIAVYVEYNHVGKMPHFAFTGSIGLDLFAEKRYFGTYRPTLDIKDSYEGVIDIPDDCRRQYTINLPLYSSVKKICVGVKEGSILEKAEDYAIKTPIVYYGSSITQGGCASKPGSSYQSIISRLLNCDYINLGFSGNAKGEDAIANYIAGLNMSAFVYDYDHNAPSVEHLRKTHERMFKIIRKANPNLPVLFLSRPKYYLSSQEKERLEVVKQTYENALAVGDKNVYFIPGPDLVNTNEIVRETALVDNCHPNDSGFVSMASVIYEKLKEILN